MLFNSISTHSFRVNRSIQSFTATLTKLSLLLLLNLYFLLIIKYMQTVGALYFKSVLLAQISQRTFARPHICAVGVHTLHRALKQKKMYKKNSYSTRTNAAQ